MFAFAYYKYSQLYLYAIEEGYTKENGGILEWQMS